MRGICLGTGLLLTVLWTASPCGADDPQGTVGFKLPSVGGWAMSPEGDTLVVSSPSTGELFVFNPGTGELTRQFEVDFQPTALALPGGRVFAAARGANRLFAVNLKTGRAEREFDYQGEEIRSLTCHFSKGPVFAARLDERILAFDPRTGRATQTDAGGMFVAIDPKGGDHLFTGTNRPSQDFIEATREGRFETDPQADDTWAWKVFRREIKRDQAALGGADEPFEVDLRAKNSHIQPAQVVFFYK